MIPVRFLAGSRAEQTPVALYWQGRWRPVRLVSETLEEEAGPGRARRRRFLVRDQGGSLFRVQGRGPEQWELQRVG